MRGVPESPLVRLGVVAAGCTLLLTASFVGVLALVEGATDVRGRLPAYVLALAVAFSVTVFLAEQRHGDGRAIIATAAGVGLVAFFGSMLAVEGLVYAVANPYDVFDTSRLPYLLAAGLLGTGVGYWALNHWREFTSTGAEE